MHRKKIQEKLNKEIGLWIDSIEDPEVKKKIQGNIIVTGGAIASLLESGTFKDIDVYLTNVEAAMAIAQYYVKRFKGGDNSAKIIYNEETNRIKIFIESSGIAEDKTIPFLRRVNLTKEEKKKNKKKTHQPIFLSRNAISLTNRIQIIIRFFGTPEEIHENFDYIHCLNYWTDKDNKVYFNKKGLESLVCKRLIYQGSKYPICSIFRMRKFIERGWTISAGQVLKMAWQISKLDLEDFEVLEEQLIGVDSAYFQQLVNTLIHDKLHGRNIDEEYLVKVINRLFEGDDD